MNLDNIPWSGTTYYLTLNSLEAFITNHLVSFSKIEPVSFSTLISSVSLKKKSSSVLGLSIRSFNMALLL